MPKTVDSIRYLDGLVKVIEVAGVGYPRHIVEETLSAAMGYLCMLSELAVPSIFQHGIQSF